MKTPKKAKDKIWEIANRLGLSDIVIGHGVDRIWERIQEETEEDLFLSYEDACIGILKELKNG